MGLFTYQSPRKSYLGRVHDPYWDSITTLINISFPRITLTIMSVINIIPVFILFGLYVSQIIDYITVYSWLFRVLIFYINADAIAEKLSLIKNKNNSSSCEQMINHIYVVLFIWCIIMMLIGRTDYLQSYSYRMFVFITMISTYVIQLLCDVNKFYTGDTIIIGCGFGIIELVYLAAIISYVLSNAYYLESLAFLIQSILIITIIVGTILFTIFSLNVLLDSSIIMKREKVFNIYDIWNCGAILGLSILMVYMSDFSVHDIIISIMYLMPSIISIVFSTMTKSNTIIIDNTILNILIAKLILLFLFGSGFITTFVDAVCVSQMYYDILKKSDLLKK